MRSKANARITGTKKRRKKPRFWPEVRISKKWTTSQKKKQTTRELEKKKTYSGAPSDARSGGRKNEELGHKKHSLQSTAHANQSKDSVPKGRSKLQNTQKRRL